MTDTNILELPYQAWIAYLGLPHEREMKVYLD